MLEMERCYQVCCHSYLQMKKISHLQNEIFPTLECTVYLLVVFFFILNRITKLHIKHINEF